VWERREREQDNGAGAEKAKETDEVPAGKAEDIDSEKFWVPYQDPSTQSLKTFLRALPSGQYYDIEKGRERHDGSEGSVAAGSRHAQGEGKSPRRKRVQWDTKGGKGKSATERRGAAKCEQKGCGQLVKHKGGAGSDSSDSQDSAYRVLGVCVCKYVLGHSRVSQPLNLRLCLLRHLGFLTSPYASPTCRGLRLNSDRRFRRFPPDPPPIPWAHLLHLPASPRPPLYTSTMTT
jgi:hypothetical protein